MHRVRSARLGLTVFLLIPCHLLAVAAYAIDADGDGFCGGPPCADGMLPSDCDDDDPSRFPGATEIVDGIDNDCDGIIDNELAADLDTDGDGVLDATDNCTFVPNGALNFSPQANADMDPFGDACDADSGGDLVTTGVDFANYVSELASTIPLALPDFDHDGDGRVTVADLSTLLWFLQSGEEPNSSNQPTEVMIEPSFVTMELGDVSISGVGFFRDQEVFLGMGATFAIGTRVGGMADSELFGLGLSYFGYDPDLLAPVATEATDSIFDQFCSPALGGAVGGLENLVSNPTERLSGPISPSDPGPGGPGVRVFEGVSLTAVTPAQANDAAQLGLDGICGNGDSQFRVVFEALEQGETTIEIGTGDDLGGVVISSGTAVSDANNLVFRVKVPEPGFARMLMISTAMLIGYHARRGQRKSTRPGATACG